MNLDEIDKETTKVLNSQIANNSCSDYDYSNIKLFIGLYEFKNGLHHNLLQEEMLANIIAGHAKDNASVTASRLKARANTFIRITCCVAIC